MASSGLKRYNLGTCGDECACVLSDENPNGAWVKAEDAEREIARWVYAVHATACYICRTNLFDPKAPKCEHGEKLLAEAKGNG